MREFIISTDSTADLSDEYINSEKIAIHPINYIVDDVEYGYNLTRLSPAEFYGKMKEGRMPTTCASNPGYITELMENQVKEGYDILHISFSSAMSSSYNNAVMASKTVMEEYSDAKIIVVDSLAATTGQGLMVYYACEMKKAGKTMDEIAKWLEENKYHFVHQFVVEDLFHLMRGGRVSKSTAVIGTALKIQPVLYLDNEGRIQSLSKARGRKKALNMLVDNMAEKAQGIEQKAVMITHAAAKEDAEYVAGKIKETLGIEHCIINDLGPTIGAHTGPGAVVLSYFAKER